MPVSIVNTASRRLSCVVPGQALTAEGMYPEGLDEPQHMDKAEVQGQAPP